MQEKEKKGSREEKYGILSLKSFEICSKIFYEVTLKENNWKKNSACLSEEHICSSGVNVLSIEKLGNSSHYSPWAKRIIANALAERLKTVSGSISYNDQWCIIPGHWIFNNIFPFWDAINFYNMIHLPVGTLSADDEKVLMCLILLRSNHISPRLGLR